VSSHVPSRLWISNTWGCPTLATSLFLSLGWVALYLFLVAASPALAQYPGQITNPSKNTPTLRAIAVLEWTGDQEHPKASRLVPVSVYDGQALEDAGVYMARPEPLALEGEVEYQLMLDGKPIGIFDVENSGREQGSWFGYGKWKPLPKPKPATQLAKIDEDNDAQSDVPVLHRKHKSGDSGSGSGSGSGSDSDSRANAPSPDPDRPTLHKGGDAGGANSTSDSSPAPDPDRPTLHKDAGDSSKTAGAKQSKKNSDDEAYVSSVAVPTDPNRPHLFRGKTSGPDAPILPSLMGLPADMQQVVAVSDAKNRPVHPWNYSWANPDDQDKMKAEMEDIARTALGLNPPPAPAPKPASKTATTRRTRLASPPTPPASLTDEQFRVFELAYGSGATMVLSTHTDPAAGPVKFVTLVAQPDLYGHIGVLVKNVTDAGHLDETPRMRLVDAVDAMADNRGELLFELRGSSQRQFALYRVLRGEATRIFVSGGDAIGPPAGE
jgi:hypothetical protein